MEELTTKLSAAETARRKLHNELQVAFDQLILPESCSRFEQNLVTAFDQAPPAEGSPTSCRSHRVKPLASSLDHDL